ncbi:MAG: methylated-DNA--[Clostridia bacterium]|nr:methylated-DNA--[protein]-cysteine S-methyltransferase [Clostridia bacterium]MBR0406674.1 methylated-DNA--[protein]-cysteine S-methyltransferase [Clostridia bacterium]
MDAVYHVLSPLGGITLTSDGEALTGLWFDGQKHFPERLIADFQSKPLPVFEEAERWLNLYFSGQEPGFTPPLTLRGTPFQRGVWEILRAIPYGKTVTYGEIAAQIARQNNLPRMSAQAVGSAVGRNPISLIVPCHRVLGANGSLTGYAGGIEKKRFLLEMEKQTTSKEALAD